MVSVSTTRPPGHLRDADMSVLSRADLPRINSAIRDLYRAVELNPEATPPDWWAEYPAKCFHPAEPWGPPTKARLIYAARDWVLAHLMPGPDGWHTRRDCPEITNSRLDVKTQAVLLELRDELNGFAVHGLAMSPVDAVRGLRYLEEVLDELETSDGSSFRAMPSAPRSSCTGRRKRGAKPAVDGEQRERLAKAWEATHHLHGTYENFARAMGCEVRDVELAVDWWRKQHKGGKGRKSSRQRRK